jgi:hypothetical protein
LLSEKASFPASTMLHQQLNSLLRFADGSQQSSCLNGISRRCKLSAEKHARAAPDLDTAI